MGSSDFLQFFTAIGQINLGSLAEAFDDGTFGSIVAGGNGVDLGGILNGMGSTINLGI